MPGPVGTKEWQSAQLKRWGFAHVSPDEVRASYEQLEHAAAVLGRDDLASELSSRVTPGLCRKYAPLLSVLRGLARDPLSAPLPHAAEALESTDPQEIWKEAMAGLEDQLEVAEPSEFGSDSDHDSRGGLDSRSNSGSDYEHAKRGLSDSEPSEPLTESPEPVPDRATDFAKYAVQRPEPAKPAQTLSQKQIVQELKLFLQRISCWEYQYMHGISARCSNSVWASFRQLGDALWSLETRDAALAEIRELTCVMVTDFLLNVERIYFEHRTSGRGVDTAAVNAWLRGSMGVRQRVLTRESLEKAMNISEVLQHPRLTDAVLFATIAREYHVELPADTVAYRDAHQYSRAISRIYSRNADFAMNAGLRDCILSTWDRLSSVFLAQDPRILMFIYEWSLLTRESQLTADELLRSMVPGVSLGPDGIPRLDIELPPHIQSLYGRNLQHVFSRASLERLWLEVTNAFKTERQEVELQMAARAAQTRARILSMKAPEPLLEEWD